MVLIALWAIVANWIAYKKGFYTLGSTLRKQTPNVQTKDLLIVFGFYLIVSYLLLPFFGALLIFLFKKMNPDFTTLPITLLTGLQFTVMLIIFIFTSSHLRHQGNHLLQRLWKEPNRSSFGGDITMGILAWFLSFPLVTLLSEGVDTLMKRWFDLQNYEQAAVKFVKLAMKNPSSLVFALLSVLVLAPLLEELLFRGVLQTYLKKRLGAHAAILIASLTFALFHFSPTQGLGNVSLVISLFLLGGFLGILYERQGSLFSSITLHMLFNAISAYRIIALPEVA